MKKYFAIACACILAAGCAKVGVVSGDDPASNEVAISFATNSKNITKSTQNLEATLHYNFGVWAQKTSSSLTTQKLMENYLVGFGGTNVGYDHTGATTWAASAGTTDDNKSPWFYEKLGNTEYTYSGTDGYYTASQTAYMSANANQYLRYWDLAYTNTYFYCYAPYKASGVTATLNDDGTATITFDAANSMRDGYDNTLNSNYANVDRSLSEFMFAGVKATNSAHADVIVPFKHMGAQLFIRFYEDVPGYKVEILDLDADNGKMASTATADQKKGIQATPATLSGTTYTLTPYYTTSGATVVYDTDAVPTYTPSTTGSTTSSENLMFKAPTTTASAYSTANVPTGFGGNLTACNGTQSSVTDHNVIPEAASTQSYAWSPTIYYPVPQPSTQQVGFTFHVTYRIISDDNKEVTTVHDAKVFVPAANTTWTSGTRYIYTFKITRDSKGSTDPDVEIDPQNPTPQTEKALFPIVFDGCTIEDFTESNSEYNIN